MQIAFAAAGRVAFLPKCYILIYMVFIFAYSNGDKAMITQEEIIADNKIPMFSPELAEVEKIIFELAEDEEYQAFIAETSKLRKTAESQLLEDIDVSEFKYEPEGKLNTTLVFEELQELLPDLHEQMSEVDTLSGLSKEKLLDAAKIATLRVGALNSEPVDAAMAIRHMESFTLVHKFQNNSMMATLPIGNASGMMYIHNLSSGSPQIMALKNSTAETILQVDIIVESIGLLLGLFGIVSTPKPNTKSLVNIYKRYVKNREFRRALKVLNEILNSRASYEKKIGAILKFLDVLRKLGALTAVIASMFDEMSGWDIAILILQFIASIIAMTNPASGTAKTLQIIGVFAMNLATIVAKVAKMP